MKRDFLTLSDLAPEEVAGLIHRALEMKSAPPQEPSDCPLIGKSIGLLFEKPSTRTRVSFEVAIYQLGGQTIFLSSKDVQLSRGETLHDTARVLSRYLSALVARTYSHDTIEVLASEADIPVINALTDRAHPCQILGDLLTVLEHRGSLEGANISYFGDGNNVANSLIIGCGMLGLNLTLACPEGYDPDKEFVDAGRKFSQESGGSIQIQRDPAAAAAGAQFLYTDVWTSMGQEGESERRRTELSPYQINASILNAAETGAKLMHCLPANRGEEITEEMMEHDQSIIIDQAENRLHAQKALLEWIVK
ncbi:MAG: ornithine carbamoyltransferase [bacterium]